MNQRSISLIVLMIASLVFGGIIVHEYKTGNKFGKGGNNQSKNWNWDDNWNNSNKPNQPPQQQPTLPPETTGPQLVAGNYAEALQKSGELGKPVLVFFTADWCQWCKKMKQETMNDPKVASVLKNYILVYVDTDRERSTARKFGVESLPSFVITNYKEEKLKSESGFKNADSFSSWLNNPSLYIQPKKDNPAPPPDKKDDRKRDPLRKDRPKSDG